ncbi:MAG: 4-hydroxybenzoate octaprenyltransferase [Planctomycetota bacterium]
MGARPPAWSSAAKAIAGDIKLAHSVFALPFAVLGAFLAAAWAGRLPGWDEALLVVACMVFARTYAMTANRLLDARIDALNPRTAGRAIPAGRVSPGQMAVACAGSAGLLLAGAGGFWALRGNPWPLAASPCVLLVLGVYPLMKRSTAWCHVVLGLALGLSPVAAALAVAPGFLTLPDAWLLAGFVLLWVAGFDVIYALLDEGFDREAGVASLPARLGGRRAVILSRVMHASAVALLGVLAWRSATLSGVFAFGVAVVAVLLAWEQAQVRADRGAPAWLFTLNGFVALALGGAGLVDVLRLV